MNKTKCILLIFTLIYMQGCYVVSDEDLYETYEPKFSIEALINNLDQPYTVKISKSANPNDSINSHPISNALIRVYDNTGNSELLKMIEPGTFIMNEMKGIPGNEYTLSVHIGIEEYSAVEMMQKPAIISRMEIKYLDKFVPEKGNYIKLYIKGEKSKIHYYKLEVSKSDSLYNSFSDLIIFDDAYFTDTVKFLVPYAFKINDSVRIDLHAISSEMYKYYYELKKQTNNIYRNIQPPMQNPPSNIQSNALGYFQVSAITRLYIVVK